jgi:predicted RNA-binding protein
MCEFKVKLGDKTIAEEIIAFKYTQDGRDAAFSDVLGRNTPVKDVVVTSVTMLPGRHEMTLIKCPAAGKAIELLLAISMKDAPGFNRARARQLLQEFTEIVQKDLK